jgi:hypothetical protein
MFLDGARPVRIWLALACRPRTARRIHASFECEVHSNEHCRKAVDQQR